MADVDLTIAEQVLCISKTKRKPHIHHNRELDDRERSLEIANRDFGHRLSVEQGRDSLPALV